jgi:hypothetical protein
MIVAPNAIVLKSRLLGRRMVTSRVESIADH